LRNLLYDLSGGKPSALIKPVLYTTLDTFIKGWFSFFALLIILELIKPLQTPGEIINFTNLTMYCLGILASLALATLFAVLSFRHTYTSAYSLAAQGRIELAEHLRKLPLGFFHTKEPGELAATMLNDYTLLEHTLSHVFSRFMAGLLLPALTPLLLAFVDVRMAIAMFVTLPAALLLIYLSLKLQQVWGGELNAAKIDCSGRLQEYLAGMKVIKACNSGGASFGRLKNAWENLMHKSIKIEAGLAPFMLLATGVLRSGLTVMILSGVYLLQGGSLDVTVLVAFLVIGAQIFEPLTATLVSFNELTFAAMAARRISAIRTAPALPGAGAAGQGGYAIEFERVGFGYGPEAVFSNLTFSIPAKAVTAIVGPSGSGKSTILRLIARFWEVQNGQIRIGGTNIREIEPEQLLKHISIVFQDVYLFHDTIYNNIKVGKEDATGEEIEQAARLAQCHDFITALPQGYDTLVGEGGSTLSGGEKQRVSLARAFLKNAPIILLDEATAALDAENERQLQQAINALVSSKTVVVIAHRLKTIKNAANIIVLANGQVVEQGSHEQLMKNQALYRRLWDLQEQSGRWQISNG
jgi:ATP-binding cassette subfamily B protein IrtB